MSRKRNSAAEDLVSLVAMAPWWVGVALAVVFDVVLHRVVAEHVATALQPGQAGTFVVQNFGTTLATFGQYLMPLICLAGAGISAWKRRDRTALFQNVMQSKIADVLDGMTGQQFDQLVGEAFRLQGYTVNETGGGGADGGVDLRAQARQPEVPRPVQAVARLQSRRQHQRGPQRPALHRRPPARSAPSPW